MAVRKQVCGSCPATTTNFAEGVAAEDVACLALQDDGWLIHGRRIRTPAGEIDAVAEKDGLLAFVEVKARRSLREAAEALRPRQQRRLLAAAEILLGANPGWGTRGVRFDVILVNPRREVRRIMDAIRLT
jgi:putative endonuclease